MKKNKGMIVVICISVVLVVAINTFCVLVACCPELLNKIFHININVSMSGSERVESSLLSTGLAILGIAVAVWTGVSIANTIDRKRIDEIDNRIQKINKQAVELQETVDTIENTNNEHNQVDKAKLLQEMQLSASDLATRALIKMVESLPTDTSIPFVKLLAVEQAFRSTLNIHSSKYSKDGELIRIVEQGIEFANNANEAEGTPNDVVKLYLDFRIAEFNFYYGYCCLGKECADHFLNAIEIYKKCSEKFHADIPKFENKDPIWNIDFRSCEKDSAISAYFCNTIGEAYSKIVHNNRGTEEERCGESDINSYGAMAVFYCFYATHWNTNRAVYYRNSGCALERHCGDQIFADSDLYEKLCEEYKEAITLEPKNISNFKNIVSLQDKNINRILSIKPVQLPERRIPSLNSSEFALKRNDVMQNDDLENKLEKTLEELKTTSELIKKLFPGDSVGYQYACIYYRDMCAVQVNRASGNVNKEMLERAEENWRILDIIAPYNPQKPMENPMTRILRNDLDDLEKLLGSVN